MSSKIVFIFIVSCSYCSLYSLNREDNQTQKNSVTNYLQYLPAEIRDYIASYLIPYPGRETLQELLNKENLFGLLFSQKDSSIEVTNFKIFINDGNLKLYDKLQKKSNTLVRVNKKKSLLKKMYASTKEIVTNTIGAENKITKFAISANKQYIVALESICILGKEENQKGIWFVDLARKKNILVNTPALFSNIKVDTIPDSQREEYENKGYESMGFDYDGKNTFWHMKKLFKAVAINNNKKIALADVKNIYVIDPETNTYEVKHSFDEIKKSVKSMNFNKQGTALAVSSEKSPTEAASISFITQTIETDKEPRKTMAEYFYKRRVCKNMEIS